MRVRRTIVVCGLIGVALVGSACGDASDEAVAGRNSVPTSTVPTSVTLPDGPPSISDAEYGMAMLELSNQIGLAGADLCWLDTARFDNNLAEPANPTQVEWSVYVFSRWLLGLEAAFPEHAAAISSMSIGLAEAADAAGYSVGFWHGEPATTLLADPGYVAAKSEYDAYVATNCSDHITASTIPTPVTEPEPKP